LNDVLDKLAGQGAVIERLTSDSRRAGPGAAFFAYPGEAADGRAHIPDALARGAAAVVWEEEGFQWKPEWRTPNAPVRELKQQAGRLAADFYGRPSKSIWMCGVTGTNGKTSSAYWIAHCLQGGLIGTLGFGAHGALEPIGNTTPDALENQLILKKFREKKIQSIAMEVSSHGLVQGRVNGIDFDCALFTNLSRDHLDYHGSMEAYGEAKARLFEMPGLEAAVINVEDPFGLRLAQRLAGRLRVIGYGFADSAPTRLDEYLPANVLHSIDTGQVGRFNVANVLGVVGCLLAYGKEIRQALESVRQLPAVPGRMQKIGERPLVLVDYAHTPDALEKVLSALRPVASARGGQLVAVFGAGGDRDAGKRPVMGEIAARLADRAIVTSDNPRSEDPLAIIAQVEKGMSGQHEAEPDRAKAIEHAIAHAADADVVLIAGKGHETYQEISGRREPFSDAQSASAALARRTAA
jgi:UDP-N-acetylmuramoyl-L-alanyl-D-glutamate--2,6-diaminopimelate ligase